MKKIPSIPTDKVVLLNISRRYNAEEKDGHNSQNMYELTRKFWKIDKSHAEEADFAFGVANGKVVSVYRNLRWQYEEYNGYLRCSFEAEEVSDSPYLGMDVSGYIRSQNPIAYVNC